MANTAVVTSLSGIAVSSACIVLVKVHAEVDGQPLGVPPAEGGGVTLFDNGTFFTSTPFVRDDSGNWWFRFTRTNGAHAIRAAINDPSTPISNTVTITWGAGSCPDTLPTPPVLTAEATPASVRLDWNAYAPPYSPAADYPPLLGWAIYREAGFDPSIGVVHDFVPPDVLTYNDWGQGFNTGGTPEPLPTGVELRYRVLPFFGATPSASYWSNIAAATITERNGLSLDHVRYRAAG